VPNNYIYMLLLDLAKERNQLEDYEVVF